MNGNNMNGYLDNTRFSTPIKNKWYIDKYPSSTGNKHLDDYVINLGTHTSYSTGQISGIHAELLMIADELMSDHDLYKTTVSKNFPYANFEIKTLCNPKTSVKMDTMVHLYINNLEIDQEDVLRVRYFTPK